MEQLDLLCHHGVGFFNEAHIYGTIVNVNVQAELIPSACCFPYLKRGINELWSLATNKHKTVTRDQFVHTSCFYFVQQLVYLLKLTPTPQGVGVNNLQSWQRRYYAFQ